MEDKKPFKETYEEFADLHNLITFLRERVEVLELDIKMLQEESSESQHKVDLLQDSVNEQRLQEPHYIRFGEIQPIVEDILALFDLIEDVDESQIPEELQQ